MNYEKKYRYLVEAVKKLQEANPSDEGIQKWVEDNVPELAESEDEKIRKDIISYLKSSTAVSPKTWIEWLEKQGKQKHKIQPKFKIGDVLHNIINGEDFIVDRISDACYINDDKCIYFPIREQEKLYLVEQKPADSKIIDLDELVIELEETIGTSPHSRETIKDFFQKAVQKYMRCLQIANGEIGRLMDENYYLKEQKPAEWSEEDKERIEQICHDLKSGMINFYANEVVKGLHYKEIIESNIEWLKSLSPQSQWKPSDQMLEALYRVIPENTMEISEDEMLLDKLYQGLKYGKVLSEK